MVVDQNIGNLSDNQNTNIRERKRGDGQGSEIRRGPGSACGGSRQEDLGTLRSQRLGGLRLLELGRDSVFQR
jgi:hypothetical protein